MLRMKLYKALTDDRGRINIYTKDEVDKKLEDLHTLIAKENETRKTGNHYQ